MRISIIVAMLAAMFVVGCDRQDVVENGLRLVDGSLIQDRNGVAYIPNEQEAFTGQVVEKYPSGQVRSSAFFVDGALDMGRPVEKWHENGVMAKQTTILFDKDGKVIGSMEKTWYDNTQAASLGKVFNDGTKNIKSWRENGALWRTTDIDGTYTNYYENGQIRTTSTDGTYTSYYETGQVELQGKNLSPNVECNSSCKEGEWISYDESGDVEKIEIWRNGVNLTLAAEADEAERKITEYYELLDKPPK